MHANGDPAIRLFGQKIPLTPDSDKQQSCQHQGDKDAGVKNVTKEELEADQPLCAEEPKNSGTFIGNSKTPSTKSEGDKTENEEESNEEEKTLKKPDKALPCPRCNSMDTKFCYYNNYNINQPRYFCKACQRYWTAGGTMRNVPVGAGRRKSKNSTSSYRHITISEALEATRIDASDGTHHPSLQSKGEVLSFGVDAPVCDSMASSLNLGERSALSGTRNGFQHGFQDQVPSKEKGDDSSTSSSVAVSSSMGENNNSTFQQQPLLQNYGFHPQLPCISGFSWPYGYSPVSSPALHSSGFPLSVYPANFLNCGMPVGNWNVPWFSSHSSASKPSSSSSGPNSPTLGKHSRDSDMIRQDSLRKEEAPKPKNGSVLVPKTLRIGDPVEAAKSSIWETLGIKNESLSGGSMFNAFQPKNDEKNQVEVSPVLMANPAALSRSLNFRENS
ncbi:hypothetical protein Fmac_026400 [Flemingia macrophylla]|uniref:Dof-type domain-containing protein n=1 Tax=Flemingia macrophylla TaxID=520843 RepID=A0ABD1LEV3_9FABA